MQDNSDKQNEKFLGDLNRGFDIRKLPDCEFCNGHGHWITEEGQDCICSRCNGSGKDKPATPGYFIGTENGIADIETPPSDN